MNQGSAGTDEVVRVAVVGVGEMGERHVRVFSACGGVKVVGVTDANGARARVVADRFGVSCLSDEAEAIAHADAVVVATPIAAHAACVERALEAGRHVLVEKPVCARVSDAERLVALAERRGARLFVGHSERFNPALRALVREVRALEIREMELYRAGPPASARPRSHDGGVLLNLGIHDVDLAAWLTRSTPIVRRADGDETRARVVLAVRGGGMAVVRVDRAAAARRRFVRLVTADGTYEADLLAPRLVRRDAHGRAEERPLDAEEPLAAQARALVDALAGRPSEIATGAEGSRALAIVEHAAAAMVRPPLDQRA